MCSIIIWRHNNARNIWFIRKVQLINVKRILANKCLTYYIFNNLKQLTCSTIKEDWRPPSRFIFEKRSWLTEFTVSSKWGEPSKWSRSFYVSPVNDRRPRDHSRCPLLLHRPRERRGERDSRDTKRAETLSRNRSPERGLVTPERSSRRGRGKGESRETQTRACVAITSWN